MQHKISKYLNKLSNENIQSEKFGLYLTKLNYWYQQYGGAKNKTENEKKDILKNIDELYTLIKFPYKSETFKVDYDEFIKIVNTKDIEYSKKVNEVKKNLIIIINKIYKKDPFLREVCDKLNHYNNCKIFENTIDIINTKFPKEKYNILPSSITKGWVVYKKDENGNSIINTAQQIIEDTNEALQCRKNLNNINATLYNKCSTKLPNNNNDD